MTRVIGALGMSIGTSAAIEQNDAASQIRLSDVVLFNLLTLIRNAHDAYETKEEKEKLTADQVFKDVIEDLKSLAKWMEVARKTKPIEMIVYYPSYTTLGLRFPLADLKKPKTELQIKYDTLSKEVAKKIYSKYEKIIKKTDVGMPTFKGKGIVLTHHVVDLVMVDAIARLTLLESYTGKLKPYTLWNTKLTGGDELFYMPFNKLTIQVFGDKSTNFKSSSAAIKDLVKELAKLHSWTSATTMSRVRANINSLPQGVNKAGLLKML